MQSNASLQSPSSSVPQALAAAGQAEVINIQQSDELERWIRTLGVSEEQLRVAVAVVGVQAEDVRNHFGVLRTSA